MGACLIVGYKIFLNNLSYKEVADQLNLTANENVRGLSVKFASIKLLTTSSGV